MARYFGDGDRWFARAGGSVGRTGLGWGNTQMGEWRILTATCELSLLPWSRPVVRLGPKQTANALFGRWRVGLAGVGDGSSARLRLVMFLVFLSPPSQKKS